MSELKKVKIFGKYVFYYLPNDKYIGQRIALEKYEPYETKLILRQVKTGDMVVDVVANIGYYTILLADKVGKTGKIYAFEPDKLNFEIMVKNVKANKLENVIAVNAAAGSKPEKLKLHKSKENFGDHKLYGQEKETEEVKIIRMDDYLQDINIDLMKIDTQGWEPEVIEGAKKIIKKNKPAMFLEYSPISYQQAKLSGRSMINFLRKNYKKIWWIDEWLYIYKNLSEERINEICKTNNTGYVDLWMKKQTNLNDYCKQFSDIKLKQYFKRFFSGL
jgi:FkbM family methyltransferase